VVSSPVTPGPPVRHHFEEASPSRQNRRLATISQSTGQLADAILAPPSSRWQRCNRPEASIQERRVTTWLNTPFEIGFRETDVNPSQTTVVAADVG